MALRRRDRGWTLAIPLALLALYTVQPSGAFEYATTGSRSVSADIVPDASAYNAVSGGICTLSGSGGTCTITISNKANSPQTYTVTLSEDESDAIGLYNVGGGTLVSSGPTSTPAEIAVGSSATVLAEVSACVCSRHAYWTIEGSKAGVLNSQELRYRMTIS